MVSDKELKQTCAIIAVTYNRIANMSPNKLKPFHSERMRQLIGQWNDNCKNRFGDIKNARFD